MKLGLWHWGRKKKLFFAKEKISCLEYNLPYMPLIMVKYK